MDFNQLQHIWLQQPVSDRLPVKFRAMKSKLALFTSEEGRSASLAGMVFMLVFGAMLAALAFFKGNVVLGMLALPFWVNAWSMGERARLAGQLPDPAQDPVPYLEAHLGLVRQVIRSRRRLVWPMAGYALVFSGWLIMQGGWTLADTLALAGFGGVAALLGGVLWWWYRYQHPYRPEELARELEELLRDWGEGQEFEV